MGIKLLELIHKVIHKPKCVRHDMFLLKIPATDAGLMPNSIRVVRLCKNCDYRTEH